MRWGVDSDAVVTRTWLGQVTHAAGRKPAFWGRYIGGNTDVGEPLSAAEAAHIHENGIKVALIYNKIMPSDPSSTAGAGNASAHAEIAVAFARSIGVPAGQGLCIYADVENWPTTAAWIAAWMRAIASSGYRAGFYGSLSLSQFASSYVAASSADLSAFSHVFLYGNQPSRYTTPANLGVKSTPANYAPCVPPGNERSASIWQYLLADARGSIDVDADLATEQGYGSMW